MSASGHVRFCTQVQGPMLKDFAVRSGLKSGSSILGTSVCDAAIDFRCDKIETEK